MWAGFKTRWDGWSRYALLTEEQQVCCRVLLPPLVCSMRPSPACAHEHVLRWRVARCTGGWGWAAVAASSRRLLVVASVLASFSFYSVWCRVVSVRCVRGWPVVRMCGREGSGWLGGVKVRFWFLDGYRTLGCDHPELWQAHALLLYVHLYFRTCSVAVRVCPVPE